MQLVGSDAAQQARHVVTFALILVSIWVLLLCNYWCSLLHRAGTFMQRSLFNNKSLHCVRDAIADDGVALRHGTGCETDSSFEIRLRSLSSCQRILVLSDSHGGILAAASLLLEHKCARGGRAAGHMRALLPPFGNATLITDLLRIARENECYKVIVNAPPTLVPLLDSLGFVRKELTMVAPLDSRAEKMSTACRVSRTPHALAIAGYTVRPLEESDGADAYVHLLSQLSCAPTISDEVFRRQLARQRDTGSKHVTYVVEGPCTALDIARSTPLCGRLPHDPHEGGMEARAPLCGCATVVLEEDVLSTWDDCSGGRPVALIEDVVVDEHERGTGLGRALLRTLLEICEAAGCASAVLNCSEANAPFYLKCGFAEAAGGEACYAAYLDA